MVAEASQYRETLRIEERIDSDPVYRQQWEERQIRLESLGLSLPEDEDGEVNPPAENEEPSGDEEPV